MRVWRGDAFMMIVESLSSLDEIDDKAAGFV